MSRAVTCPEAYKKLSQHFWPSPDTLYLANHAAIVTMAAPEVAHQPPIGTGRPAPTNTPPLSVPLDQEQPHIDWMRTAAPPADPMIPVATLADLRAGSVPDGPTPPDGHPTPGPVHDWRDEPIPLRCSISSDILTVKPIPPFGQPTTDDPIWAYMLYGVFPVRYHTLTHRHDLAFYAAVRRGAELYQLPELTVWLDLGLYHRAVRETMVNDFVFETSLAVSSLRAEGGLSEDFVMVSLEPVWPNRREQRSRCRAVHVDMQWCNRER